MKESRASCPKYSVLQEIEYNKLNPLRVILLSKQKFEENVNLKFLVRTLAVSLFYDVVCPCVLKKVYICIRRIYDPCTCSRVRNFSG